MVPIIVIISNNKMAKLKAQIFLNEETIQIIFLDTNTIELSLGLSTYTLI